MAGSPDHALSRLISPRRLRPLANYHAFVVPAFESGRLAGLGTPDETVPAQQPSWGEGQPRRFPVYYQWALRTSAVGDFETLARRPRPFVVGPGFGKRPLDVSDPGAGMTAVAGTTVDLEGALQPVNFSRAAYPAVPGTVMRDELVALVDRQVDFRDADPGDDDPIISPPAYARLPAGMQRVADAAEVPDAAWLAELNGDPRNRAVAGLGAELVRQRDDELMERAWAQVDAL